MIPDFNPIHHPWDENGKCACWLKQIILDLSNIIFCVNFFKHGKNLAGSGASYQVEKISFIEGTPVLRIFLYQYWSRSI